MMKTGFVLLFATLLIVFCGAVRYVEFVRADIALELERIDKTPKKKKIPDLTYIGPGNCVWCHRWGK